MTGQQLDDMPCLKLPTLYSLQSTELYVEYVKQFTGSSDRQAFPDLENNTFHESRVCSHLNSVPMECSPLTKEQKLPTLRGMFRKTLQRGFTAEHLLTEHFETLNPHTLVERAGSNDLGTHCALEKH